MVICNNLKNTNRLQIKYSRSGSSAAIYCNTTKLFKNTKDLRGERFKKKVYGLLNFIKIKSIDI